MGDVLPLPQDTVESMVRSAQDKCPNVLSEEKVVNDIRTACLAKSQVCCAWLPSSPY